MRVILKFGIDQIRKLAGAAMYFDDVGAFHVSQVGPPAPFVNAQERFETVKRAAVDVEIVRELFSYG